MIARVEKIKENINETKIDFNNQELQKVFLEQFDENSKNNLLKLIEDTGVLNVADEDIEKITHKNLDNLGINALNFKTKSINLPNVLTEPGLIEKYVSNDYWKYIRTNHKLFVENVVKYRQTATRTLKTIYDFLRTITLAKHFGEEISKAFHIIYEGISIFTDVSIPTQWGDLGDFAKLGAAISLGLSKLYDFLHNFKFDLNFEEEDVIFLISKKIEEKSDIVLIHTLLLQAHQIYKDKPWYKKLISGKIVENNLKEEANKTRDEILKATGRWYYEYVERIRFEHERHYGGY